MTARVLGAVLAGGSSRRFGSDKARALLDGTPLIEHVIARLLPQVDALVVVGRDWVGVTSIADRPAAALGPLGGLAAALAFAAAQGFDTVLTSGCDLPTLPQNLATVLGDAPAVALGQPLLGVWPAGLSALLDAHLAADERSLRSWVRCSGAREVDLGPIANINTTNDLDLLTHAGELAARSPLRGSSPDGVKTMATAYGKTNDGSGAMLAGALGFGLGLAASVGRKAAVQAITASAGDWFEGLKAEHKMAKGIIEMMEKTTDRETTKRAALLLSLQHALGKHAVQEEDVIYCAIRASGDVADADQLGQEHNAQVKQGLYDLEQIDKTTPAWLARLAVLKADIEHHVREEEDVVYPRLRAKLSAEENKKLTGRMNREGFKVA